MKKETYKIWQMVKNQGGKEVILKEIGYYTTSWYDSFYHFFYQKFYIENENTYKNGDVIKDKYNKITITCDEIVISESKHFIYETDWLFNTRFGMSMHFTMTDAFFEILMEKDFENIENRGDFLSEEQIWKRLKQA